MYQPLIKFHPYPAIITQVLTIFVLPAMTEEQLNILRKYFPAPPLPSVAQWIPRYGVYLCITRARRSKHGDFTLAPVRGMHRITVNGSLHPYAFLLTFVHELAHLRVLKRYGSRVMPHGAEWKTEFRALMLALDLRAIYPSDVLVPLADYLKNPKASSDRHTALAMALERYSQPEVREAEMTMVSELPAGAHFLFRGQREFVLGEKRRRLYLCTEIDTGRKYLFQPHIRVKLKTNDE